MRTKHKQLNGKTAKYTCKRIRLLRLIHPLPRLGMNKFQPAEKVSVDETKDEETTGTKREQAWMDYKLLLLILMMILIICRNSHLKP